jgi:hypothetical protein
MRDTIRDEESTHSTHTYIRHYASEDSTHSTHTCIRASSNLDLGVAAK